jgi:ABC-2 type transport system permease protein
MRKVLVIAIRDYLATVRTKGFLISLALMPILMSGGIVAQSLLGDQIDVRERHFAVVDRSPGGNLATFLERKSAERNQAGLLDSQTEKPRPPFTIEIVSPDPDNSEDDRKLQRFQLSERVRNQELYGFLEILPEIYDVPKSLPADPVEAAKKLAQEPASVRYQSNHPLDDLFPKWAEKYVNDEVLRRRLDRASIPPGTVEAVKGILSPVRLDSKDLTRRDPNTGDIVDAPDESKFVSIMAPFGLLMLMFMVIMVGATPLMQGVVEEKMQRIAEVLLGSVRPFQLMLGKLFGTVGVSLTLVVVYLGGAYFAAQKYGFAEHLPAPLVGWFVAYQVLAVTLFGSLFIAIGAACTDMKETQSLMWPVMLLAVLPMMVGFVVIKEPNSPFATWTSFFPPATPMLMMARQAVPPGIAPWQPILGIVLVLATTLVCVYAAGRIFRVGILMQGKGAKVGDILRWLIRG